MANTNALGSESAYQAGPDLSAGLFLLVSRHFQALNPVEQIS